VISIHHTEEQTEKKLSDGQMKMGRIEELIKM
jgi:hypothetical protein